MQFLSLEPFIPSGADMEKSKQLFIALGFTANWDAGDYSGFQLDNCKYILQNFNNKSFAENLMIKVKINSAEELWQLLNEKKLVEKFDIKISAPKKQPYGIEVNLIDLAGVCWHFVE